MRGCITKSKAGHYTVTLRDSKGFVLSIRDKIASLGDARNMLSMLKKLYEGKLNERILK